MRTNIYHFMFRRFSTIAALIGFVVLSGGCNTDNVDEYYVTFTGDMIYSYLKSEPESFSEFIQIIDDVSLKGMLSAYGSYTCLAPTNEAIDNYLSSLGDNFTYDSLSYDEKDYIARTHIIPKEYLTSELVTGAIPTANMNQRYILINFTTDSAGSLVIKVNNDSKITEKDIEVYNGSIQVLDNVLSPSNAQIPDLIAENEDASIFSAALVLTGLDDSLRLVEDESYEPVDDFTGIYGTGNVPSPEYRKYGYTVFVESDEVLAANGINTLEDLKQYAASVYTSNSEVTDPTDERNSLNQFMAYHLLDKMVYYNSFMYTTNSVDNVEHYEYQETMLSNTLMRVTDGNDGLLINDDEDREVDGVTILSPEDGVDQSAINGVFHFIDNILTYNDNVETLLLNSRIRFDVTSLLPELMTNGIRGLSGEDYCFPDGYFKNLDFSSESRIYYLGPRTTWNDYQGDEIMALGSYDFTLRLPPVPAGTYELRFGYTANEKRGVAQFYVDSDPIGIPLDLRILATDSKIGWEEDSETSDDGVENDKMMRNRGYMKGPDTYGSMYYDNFLLARDNSGGLRRIIGTFAFDNAEPHYLRIKSVLEDDDTQFHLDYLEFVPKSIYASVYGEDRH